MPEAHFVGTEVNIIRDVVPRVRRPRGVPLTLAANIPPQLAIACALLTRNQPILQLCEVALEEADLMLAECAWSVDIGALHAGMIIYVPLVDGCSRLWDELSAAHRLTIPVRCVVDGDLDSLFARCIGGVLVGW